MSADFPYLRFNFQKATEVIVYVANRTNHPSVAQLYALLLVADIKHVEHYGSFINRDNAYIATRDTLAPCVVYRIIENGSCEAFDLLGTGLEAKITSRREADTGHLSRSDLGCLEEAIYESQGVLEARLLGRLYKMWETVTLNGQTFELYNVPDILIKAEQMIGNLPNKAKLKDLLQRE